MYAGRTPPETPPCDECREILLPENMEIARVYISVRGQVIASLGGIIDINHLAVDAAINRYHIKDKQRCFDQVVKVFHHFLKEQQDQRGD